jgi:protein TonB
MRKRRSSALWKYVGLAVLLHFSILLLPSHVVETFFPTSAPEDAGPPADLTPDFEQYAIHVVYIDDEPPQVEVTRNPAVEMAPLEVEPQYVERLTQALAPEPAQDREVSTEPHGQAAPPPSGEGPDVGAEPGAGGDQGLVAAEQPRFYPPVPRLIVPPSVENLDIKDLTITLRILVDREGRPVQVVIVNPPDDVKVYERVMEAAEEFRFTPARRGDEPVESWIELPLNLETTRRD